MIAQLFGIACPRIAELGVRGVETEWRCSNNDSVLTHFLTQTSLFCCKSLKTKQNIWRKLVGVEPTCDT